MAALGRKLRPIVKGFLRQMTPIATKKLKEIGTDLISSGGAVLSEMANRKRQRGGNVTETYIKTPTPALSAPIPPQRQSTTVKPRKRRKKKKENKKVKKKKTKKKHPKKQYKKKKKQHKKKKQEKKGGKKKRKRNIFDTI